jgi:hypothetical protein
MTVPHGRHLQNRADQLNHHRNCAMNRFLTVGLGAVVGAALFEVALLPAVAIGGAVLLAPKYLPRLRRQVEAAAASVARPPIEAPAATSPREEHALSTLQRLGVSQALAKTISFGSSLQPSTLRQTTW